MSYCVATYGACSLFGLTVWTDVFINICSLCMCVCVSTFNSLPQTKSVTYEQEVYNQFTYKKDRPYFHSFSGDVSLYHCSYYIDM